MLKFCIQNTGSKVGAIVVSTCYSADSNILIHSLSNVAAIKNSTTAVNWLAAVLCTVFESIPRYDSLFGQ